MSRLGRALNELFRPAAKNAPQPGSVQTSFQLAQVLGLNQTPAMKADELGQQVAEGYGKNVIVYRCVQEVARSAAAVKPILYRKMPNGDLQELNDTEFNKVLRRPNFRQSYEEFLESNVSYFMLGGNAYFQMITVDGGRRVKEMWPLRPDMVAPVERQGKLEAYRVTTNMGTTDFPVDPITGACEIVHIKTWNPSNQWKGMSPLQAAALSTDIHNATSIWNKSLLDNGAQPSGALVMAAAQGGVPTQMTEQEISHLKEELEISHSGSGNVGRPMLLTGGLDWKPMGLSPKDMDFLNSRNTTAREIALAFGVPPMLLGIPGDNTYSNQREARLWFTTDTVLPVVGLMFGGINAFLEARYPGLNLFLGYDEDTISALSPRREELWDRVNKSEFLTLNEKREALGYEIMPGMGGTIVFVDDGKVPVDIAAQGPVSPTALLPAAEDPPVPVGKPTLRVVKSIQAEIEVGSVYEETEKKYAGVVKSRDQEIEARLRLTEAAELAFKGRVQRNLRNTMKDVVAVLRTGTSAGVEEAIFNQQEALEEVLRAGHYAIAEIMAKRFLKTLKSYKLPIERKDLLGNFWSRVQPFVEAHVARQVTNISDTTRKQVQTAIAEGLIAGLGYDAIATLVQAFLTESSASRALTIAATEAHTASSYSAQAAAQSVGTEMEREWAAAGGDRTRPSHREADGQKRSMEEPFTVGRSSLMYPGDPRGAAAEIINCRCVILYNPLFTDRD